MPKQRIDAGLSWWASPPTTRVFGGDILMSVQSPDGETQLRLDAQMRVQHTPSWRSDRLNFEMLPDLSQRIEEVIEWKVVVYREGKQQTVDIELAPSSLEGRHLFPECRKDLRYVTLGGMTFMNLSRSQEELLIASTEIMARGN